MSTIRYASVCDGIGAVHVAWQPLGWTCAWTSEIEPFPIAVVEHHWKFPNVGDMTKIDAEKATERYGRIDLLVGGTPCQDFSVAGKGAGWTGARGTLTSCFVELVRQLHPRWVVWENVPGVLMPKHRAGFVGFLGRLAEFGYGVGWRVLDAQYHNLAQRRARVFVVGHFGDWRRAAEVLFDPACLSWDSAPRREAGEGTARETAPSLRGCGVGSERIGDTRGQDCVVASPITAGYAKGAGVNDGPRGSPQNLIIQAFGGNNTSGPIAAAAAVNAGSCKRLDFESETFVVSPPLKSEGFDASEDGTGRGTPIVPVAIQEDNQNGVTLRDTAGSLRSDAPGTQPCGTLAMVPEPFAFQTRCARNGRGMPDEIAPALTSCEGGTHADTKPHVVYPIQEVGKRESKNQNGVGIGVATDAPMYTLQAGAEHGIATEYAVRRLLPVECERLQGFPDNYTAITFRGKPATDGPRYRALGNSMAVPVMARLGRRIQEADQRERTPDA